MNRTIEIGPDGDLIQITTLGRKEWAECFDPDEPIPTRTALFTVRAGKDTAVTEAQLRKLARECLRVADSLKEG